ncbi:acyl-[ACP]--phospholipid O-acyltransferase [Roseomonas sp. NAR14]|uniref:Acyl-[ACP]--phospholipid O-acyltransferase n=1 Tax=Roseomonas acroporae TaxID=2937791 RepID=A0A9X2BWQ9_9PROT|nr:acyl-[ACP]--phospholipid O-acyltransferase [Roseomonas acroporae]MCK8784155.1 acyl-[ACP]--phospholipid O-acyltransferase [Roseomonas acroporae]
MTPSPSLLRTRRFLPLLVTQTLGALNDNLFKNALVVLTLFQAAQGGAVLVAAAGGVFILPYVLFSSIAGQLADRSEKSRLIRRLKWLELGLMVLAVAGFLSGSLPLLFAVLFGLGVQATFFSPLKYGILPDHLAESELVAGNGLIEAGTFLGILAGTIVGGALVLLPGGREAVSVAGLLVAVAGLVAAMRIPPAPAADPTLRLGWNLPRETWGLLRTARENRPVWLAILAIGWFWTIGATVLSVFPVIARDTLAADGHVVTLFLTLFALGVGIGSTLCARLLGGEISARYVPFAALGISLAAWDFARTAAGATGLHDVAAMLGSAVGWRLLLDLALLGACGGIYSVPLYTIMQERSAPALRSRMIACNNVMNAFCMVVGAAAVAGLAAAGIGPTGTLLIAAAINTLVAFWIVAVMPRDTVRMVLRVYFRLFHRVEVRGLEHYRAAGERVVIVANHMSFFDGCLLGAFLPDDPAFVVDTHVARKWWARPLLSLIETFEVDPASPLALRHMVRRVREGGKLAIFPEGRITRTGALMKVYEGAAVVADRTGASLLPVRLDGPQFTPLGRMRGILRLRWFPRLVLRFGPPVRPEVDPALVGRPRRRALGRVMDAIMVDAAFAAANLDRTLFGALLDARARFGGRHAVLDDLDRAPIGFDRLVLGSAVLGRRLAAITAPGERVGLLLPNAKGTVVTFMALQAQARVPAMLNVSAGAEALLSACATAELRTVLCSRRFVEKGRLGPLVERLSGAVRFVWLEDLRAGIGTADKLRGMLDAWRARRLPGARGDADAAAVVLFTSGSEGRPKGVVLSHRNILANCAQLEAVLDFNPSDRVVNAMPLFHSFGLTGGTLLPLLNGVPAFLYPSPLHYRVLPEIIYGEDATILFGTDTFLNGWARHADSYDFRAVRQIFAGAERLREETRRLFADRFGKGILEGYGATETSPVIAINTPKAAKAGTVGRLLPGIEARLEAVPGIEEGGRLVVHGPNVMLGYLRPEAPGTLEPPPGGWYDTGDIVSIDAEGFVRILGRAKRFAKIAGEMVSMAAAEALAGEVWPEALHAVVSLPDARKGERLLLMTTQRDATPAALLARARERGVPELGVPREVRVIERMPLLGTGKTDYPAVQRLAGETVAAPA